MTNLLNDEGLANLKLATLPMEPKVDLSQSKSEILSQSQITRYRHILESLQYLTTMRPDISFAVSKLSQFFTNLTLCHWQALQRVLRYVSENPYLGLMIRPSSHSNNIEVYSDADWAGDSSDKQRHGGYVVYYGGNLVSWRRNIKA